MKILFSPNFTLLLLGQVSSLLGNYTLKFALSMYILERTGSASVFAGMLALAMLPTILLSPFGGILADRADRRKVMVGLDALSGLAVGLAALVLPRGRDLPVIGALLVVLAALGAFESPTVQACVPQMLSGEDLLRGNALVGQVSSLAGLVTPFLGSLLYTALGVLPVLWGAAACFFLTAALEGLIRLDRMRAESSGSIFAVIREDFAVTAHFLGREQPGILKLLLLAALVSLFVAGTAVVGFPFLVRTVLGLSARYYGAAESAMGLSAVLGSALAVLLAPRLRPRHLSGVFLLFGACLFPAGAAFLLPLGPLGRYLVLLAMFCLCQLGCSVFSTCAITLIQQRTPEGLMGKVVSCVFTLSLCAQPLGQVAYGALFDRFSRQVWWVLLPTGALVCAIALGSRGLFLSLEGGKEV